ncbi:hypothetical protein MKX03_024211 [Papaver bracteatum]|nr:hypothetical protein MKX03_024211 [Papaver bracteatum]
MGFSNLKKVESSSSSCKDNCKKKKIFKSRSKGIEKKLHEFKTLCGVRALLYVKSEFNKDGLVRILPENPNECQEIVRDYINYDPKTAGKRKMDVNEENQQVHFVNQKLSNLSIEEIQRIERNLEPMFGMISERINQLMEKNKSGVPFAKSCNEADMVMMNEPKFDYEPSSSAGFSNYSPALENDLDYDTNQWLNLPGLTTAEKLDELMEENKSMEKGCNEDDMVMRNESPSLPLEPKFDYPSSSSTEVFNYNSGFENEFDYGIINQEDWVNLPVLTDNYGTDDGNVFEPFPDLIDLEFQALNNYAGGFTDMMINCC